MEPNNAVPCLFLDSDNSLRFDIWAARKSQNDFNYCPNAASSDIG
jgi:hypothetical protein